MNRDLSLRQSRWLLIAVIAAAAVLRFWRLGNPGLTGDESYYWLWSEHLDLSYHDHPWGVALMIRLSTLLGGYSEAGVRWLNALLGVGAVLLVHRLGRRLFSPAAGLLAAAIVATGAPYLITARFVFTDALQLIILLANLLFLVPLLAEENDRPSSPAIWGAAITMALLFNTKYSAYVYAVSVLVLILWNRAGLLRDRRIWWGTALALTGLAPTLIWNATHDWSSFRWQIHHFTSTSLAETPALIRMVHLADYLTLPVALFALLGCIGPLDRRRRLLLVPAALLVLPVALGPADSPRNVTSGFVLLIILAAGTVLRWYHADRRRPAAALAIAAIGASAVIGAGTVRATLQPTAWPHSPVARAVRLDGSGWDRVDELGLDGSRTVFAIDYSLAGQLRYYTGLPVYSSWPQFRLWGRPDLDDVTVLAFDFIDPALVSTRLGAAFRHVSGPEQVMLGAGEGQRTVHRWRVSGCLVEEASFYEMFDLIGLVRRAQAE